MKISEAIAQLQSLLEREGDLEMFDDEGFPVVSFDAADPGDYCFPDDWNIRSRFVCVKLGK